MCFRTLGRVFWDPFWQPLGGLWLLWDAQGGLFGLLLAAFGKPHQGDAGEKTLASAVFEPFGRFSGCLLVMLFWECVVGRSGGSSETPFGSRWAASGCFWTLGAAFSDPFWKRLWELWEFSGGLSVRLGVLFRLLAAFGWLLGVLLTA